MDWSWKEVLAAHFWAMALIFSLGDEWIVCLIRCLLAYFSASLPPILPRSLLSLCTLDSDLFQVLHEWWVAIRELFPSFPNCSGCGGIFPRKPHRNSLYKKQQQQDLVPKFASKPSSYLILTLWWDGTAAGLLVLWISGNDFRHFQAFSFLFNRTFLNKLLIFFLSHS